MAKAVMQKGEELGKKALEVADFSALPGNGLTAVLSGKTLVGGSLSFIGSKTDDSKRVYRNRQKYLPNREKHRWYLWRMSS